MIKVGDLVKYRRNAVDAGLGIIIKPGAGERPAWWVVLWASGTTEVVSDRNLRLINESR